jgi:hypothetical protein
MSKDLFLQCKLKNGYSEQVLEVTMVLITFAKTKVMELATLNISSKRKNSVVLL